MLSKGPKTMVQGRRGAVWALRAAVIAAAVATWPLASCAEGKGARSGGDQMAAADPGGVDAVAASGSSSFGSYLAGRLARSERDTASAADFLLHALADDPDNADLRNQAFQALLVDNRMPDAVNLARQIAADDPSAPLAGLLLGVEAVRLGDYPAARAHLGALTQSGYNAVLLPLIGAWVGVGEGQGGKPGDELGSVRSEGGFLALRSFHQGLIFDLAGDTRSAEAMFLSAHAIQPGAFRLVEALGGLYERTGRPDDARRLYEDFLDANPDSPWPDAALARIGAGDPPQPIVNSASEGVAEVLFGLASALQQEESLDSALAYARMAGHLRPGSDFIALLIGDVFEAQGRSDQAIQAYRQVAADSPLSWSARLRIAVNLDGMGRTEEAVQTLSTMAAERPERTDALVTLGDVQRGQENWPGAIAAYDGALQRIGSPDARHWRILYARGIAHERARDWPKAEADFLKALELEPEHPFVLNYLGYTWVDRGEHLDEALGMIERAVDQRPNDGFIVDSLGWAHYRLGDYHEAVRQLERAVELQPDDPTINDHLGDALWQVGRVSEARFQWRRALTLGPDEDLATAIRAKLDHGLAGTASTTGG